MPGETSLDVLIAQMEPELHEGHYVFSTLNDFDAIPRAKTVFEFKENEGLTVVLTQEDADFYGLSYSFVASWITLNIHSALEAVGLTAAFSTTLGKHNISCNVVAAYYHDHIFVDVKDGEKAMEVLQEMSSKRCTLDL